MKWKSMQIKNNKYLWDISNIAKNTKLFKMCKNSDDFVVILQYFCRDSDTNFSILNNFVFLLVLLISHKYLFLTLFHEFHTFNLTFYHLFTFASFWYTEKGCIISKSVI